MHVWGPDSSIRCPKTSQPESDQDQSQLRQTLVLNHLCQTVSQSFNLLFPDGSWVRNPPASVEDAGDAGSITGSGRSPGKGNGNPLQYSFLENPMDRGAWRATVQRAAKSQMPHTHCKTDHQLCSENHCGKNAWGAKMSTAKTLQAKYWTHFRPVLENTKNRKT